MIFQDCTVTTGLKKNLTFKLLFTVKICFRVLLWHRGEENNTLLFLAVIIFGFTFFVKLGSFYNIVVFGDLYSRVNI